jgi:unsaturated rhamnogalacturonyl hydrolase
MRKVVVFLIVGVCIALSAIGQDDIFSIHFIQEIAGKVNKYQLDHPWREKDDNWIRGTYYTGVMAVYRATGDKKYLNQCNAWGEELGWQVPILKPGQKRSGLNLLTCGQTWLESYMAVEKKYKIRPVLDYLQNPAYKNPVSEPLEWYFEGGRCYVDGLFTGLPAFAMLYKITGEAKYSDWMDACFWEVFGALFDKNEGLFYRDEQYKPGYSGMTDQRSLRPDSIPYDEARKSYVYQKTQNGEKVIWSRGNGWAFAALTRILTYLPPSHPNYDRYQSVFKIMAAELKKRQQQDGFWYPNLADPKDYGTPETSGTGFFTYGLAWGINNGVLSSGEYLTTVEKGWGALVSAVSDEGKVQWGQLVGASPYKILKGDSHEYVTGTFLLAASEMYKLNH